MIFSLVPKFLYDENARVCLQLLGASQHHLHWFRVEWSGRGFRPTGWTYAGVWENDWTVDVLSDTCVVSDGLIEGFTLSCYFSIWNMKPLWNGHWQRSTDKITRHYLCLQCIFQCHHPTIWSFILGLKQTQRASLVHKRYRVLKQRVANAAAEMLLYLLKVSYR